MEYCYSGTESLWYGSWNRHVCRKGKFAADRHSRSTGVNPSRKQRIYCRIYFLHFYSTLLVIVVSIADNEGKRVSNSRGTGNNWMGAQVGLRSSFSSPRNATEKDCQTKSSFLLPLDVIYYCLQNFVLTCLNKPYHNQLQNFHCHTCWLIVT